MASDSSEPMAKRPRVTEEDPEGTPVILPHGDGGSLRDSPTQTPQDVGTMDPPQEESSAPLERNTSSPQNVPQDAASVMPPPPPPQEGGREEWPQVPTHPLLEDIWPYIPSHPHSPIRLWVDGEAVMVTEYILNQNGQLTYFKLPQASRQEQ